MRRADGAVAIGAHVIAPEGVGHDHDDVGLLGHSDTLGPVASGLKTRIGGRGGSLHELNDQLASFEPIVKWSGRSERVEQLPELLAEAWRQALTPPSGPTYVEIPVDVLLAQAMMPRVDTLDAKPPPPVTAPSGPLAEATRVLSAAKR